MKQEGKLEEQRDVMIITFDLDIFKEKVKDLDDLLNQQDEHLLFGLAYPSFELFLLLHVNNSLHDFIIPNKEIILQNDKIGSQRPCQYYLSKATGINSKKNKVIGNLANDIDIAIKQEKFLNQTLSTSSDLTSKLTSNIASIIETIKNEDFPVESIS